MAERVVSSEPRPPSRIGAEIHRLRLAAGKTLRHVGQDTDLDYTWLSKVENGRDWPSPRAVRAIARSLGACPDPLLAILSEEHPSREELVVQLAAERADRERLVAEAAQAERERMAQAAERGEWDGLFTPLFDRIASLEGDRERLRSALRTAQQRIHRLETHGYEWAECPDASCVAADPVADLYRLDDGGGRDLLRDTAP